MIAVLNMSKIQSKSNSQLSCSIVNRSLCCAQYVKDTIQKQFTTKGNELVYGFMLCSICQRYNPKAIHNYQNNFLQRWPLCSICQRYNPKAIHNQDPSLCRISGAVLNMSKIQSKSNSQPQPVSSRVPDSCAQYVKDTIQKQFTTSWEKRSWSALLCSICQRYNPKAIHNKKYVWTPTLCAVLNMSKIQSKSNSQHLIQ